MKHHLPRIQNISHIRNYSTSEKLDFSWAEEIQIAYVTGFAKRGLPHTSNLQTSKINNFRCVIAIDLKIVQFRGLK